MNTFKKYFFILLLLELFFSYSPAYAQSQGYNYANAGVSTQIETYLCSPAPAGTTQTSLTNGVGTGLNTYSAQAAAGNSNSGALFKCINQIYKLAIAIAITVGVFFIVIAGYLYMSDAGNGESVTKAKSIIESTIASLVILFAGYLLLQTINPDLVNFQSIQPPSVVLPPPATNSTTPQTTLGNGNPASGCTGCVDLSTVNVPTKNSSSIQASQALAMKLQALAGQSNLSGINWYVTAAYDPTGGHLDACHSNGTCADIGMNPNNNAGNWSSLCSALKATGFTTILNEATAAATQCPTYQTYTSTTGPNLHVQ